MLYKSEFDEQWRRNAEIGAAKAEIKAAEAEIGAAEAEIKAEGKAQEKRDIIRSLLMMSDLPVDQIAAIAKAPIRLVEEIKKEADIS